MSVKPFILLEETKQSYLYQKGLVESIEIVDGLMNIIFWTDLMLCRVLPQDLVLETCTDWRY